ncbi:Crp/Fnr family transcriptional regulator [Paenisporosarcina antarctica]|uniref:Crp/Fnr family transcriptional regulator n=1 Tax=Paenisporosarcina antarctica TaxID=417367 RepID=A0A4P7A3K8_9BACL|nr:Crp/Fnr family transcriptional regulator [Paenisporosarcina antarctica]QBP42616.1 Crp/Fnr family transcriptional regulator [Paenisporosarcina antarctica]
MSNKESCNHYKEGTKESYKLCISLVPIFNHLDQLEMEEIVHTIKSLTLKRKELLYNAGEDSNSMYIVNKGRLKIYRLSELGKEQLIRIVSPGEFTGELALFKKSSHENYAEAMEQTEVCMMTGTDLYEFLLKYPQISLKILTEFSNRLDRTESQITSFATEDVETRIALYIAEQYEGSRSMEIQLPMSRKDLASYLGTTPETISRKLAKFEEEGWIQQKGQRGFQILDLDALLLV